MATEISEMDIQNTAVSFIDVAARKAIEARADVYYVKAPSTDKTNGTWTGTIEGLTAYYDGLTVLYVPAVAGASTTTLNLNSLGAITCYFTGTSKLTTHYPVGTPILLTFAANGWRRADYNTNTTYSNREPAENGTATSLVTTGEKYSWNNKLSDDDFSAFTEQEIQKCFENWE